MKESGFRNRLRQISGVYQIISKLLKTMGVEFREMIAWLKTEDGSAALKEAVTHVAEKFIEARATVKIVEPAVGKFPIWKTVGRNFDRKCAGDYQREWQEKNIRTSIRGKEILGRADLLTG